MTFLERLIAKLGIAGIIALVLAASLALNLWQLRKSGQAEAACEARIAALGAETDKKASKDETTSLEIGRETDASAQEAITTITNETVRYVDRIRTVEIPVAPECDGPMPERVRDALSEAAAAADRRV